MAKEEGGGAETGEKEGQNLLGEPTFKKLENGRFKCVETGHELPAHGRDSYARSKHCRLGLIDAALASKKPPLNMFSQDPLSKSKLKCKLTGLTVNKSEEHIWKHINGKRFLRIDPEEAEFWMPPVGEHWDFDDGGNRWGSGSESEPENDDANGEDELIEEATHEARELSKQSEEKEALEFQVLISLFVCFEGQSE
nr:surfeit locus protein 2 [Ipomoea batatas]